MRTTELPNAHKGSRNSIALGKKMSTGQCIGLGQVTHMCLAVLLGHFFYTRKTWEKMLHSEQPFCIWSCVGMPGNSQGVRQKFYLAFFVNIVSV